MGEHRRAESESLRFSLCPKFEPEKAVGMNWKEQISADIRNVLGTLLMYKLPAEKSSPSPSNKSDGLGGRQLVLFINSSTCLSNTNLTFWRLPLKKEKKKWSSAFHSFKWNVSLIHWKINPQLICPVQEKTKKREPDARSFFQSTGNYWKVS